MTDKTPQTSARQRAARWQRWLLVASLALNLLILGAVAGTVLRGGPPGGAGRFDLSVGPLARALTPEDRRAVGEVLRERRPFDPQNRRALREDFEVMVAVLAAPEFDRAALQDLFMRQRGRMIATQDAALEVVLDRIAAMSAGDRAALAARLEQELRGRGDRPGPSRTGAAEDN